METGVDTAIAAVAGLAGVGLGYLGSAKVSRREREAAGRDELRRAFARYLGALYAVVAELRAAPATQPGKLADLVDRVRGEAWTYVSTRRRLLATLGPRPLMLSDRLADAVAHLQVL